MKGGGLFAVYESIAAPADGAADSPLYAVRPVPGSQSYFVGKDALSHACLLIVTSDHAGRKPPPIRLESLDAQFELRCQIRESAGSDQQEGHFTVIRCRSLDRETIRYFLSVCRIITRLLGEAPSRGAIASAVQRLASIFQSIRRAPVRSLNGLFGELYLISRSGVPARAVAAWRIDEMARFDFSTGDIRLEVKTSATRSRAHTFSYDQCNPPPGTMAVVASLLVERIPRGLTLADLMTAVEDRISSEDDLVLKLHDVVASTLGTSLSESLDIGFDARLAESSLRYYEISTIPALHEPLPPGVSDVRFTSDLSAAAPVSIAFLIDRDPLFWDLLPREAAQ